MPAFGAEDIVKVYHSQISAPGQSVTSAGSGLGANRYYAYAAQECVEHRSTGIPPDPNGFGVKPKKFDPAFGAMAIAPFVINADAQIQDMNAAVA